MESKIIALDFDHTYTTDPELWDLFIETARARGHTVIIATMRIEGMEEARILSFGLDKKVDDIIYTNRLAKKPALENLNISVDIWIDDMPLWILNDSL